MKIFELDTYLQNLRAIGLLAMLISLSAWTVDILEITYVCPFCRTQRTVIGVLGLFLVTPYFGHWIVRYVGTVLGAFGFVVAAMQHFRGWAKISAGEFAFHDPVYFDSFLLSGAAMFIITGLMFLLFLGSRTKGG